MNKNEYETLSYDPGTGKWEPAIPEPYYYGIFPWLWKRITGWRDDYGRKAQLYWDWWW